MSLRPRNAQPLGTGGIVRLGNSNLDPEISEYIDNGSPGFPADSFITVENRLSQPLQVSPSFQGVPDYNNYYTVPALTRSTIPIDPQRGVLLTVDNSVKIYDRDTAVLTALRTFEKRTVPYRLHSDGAAPSEPLYPLDRCLNASESMIFTSGTVYYRFVGGAWPGISNQQLAIGEDDICFRAISFFIYGNAITAGSIFELGMFFDSSNTGQKLSHVICGSATPVGTRVTVALPGPIALSFSVASSGNISVEMSYWLGIPGA